MIGIDVSNYQGVIDWPAVAAWRGPNGERIEFAAIRATEGASGSNPTFALDPFFVANWDGCKAAGMRRIAYHFGRPAWNSAQVELDWHLSQVNYLPGDGCMLDFEDPNATGDLCGWASGWVAGFDARQGFWPFFYSGLWYMTPHNLIGCAGLANDGLALADYTFAPHASLPPSPWPVTAITQYSDKGSVGGISGGVDMDFFNGDAAQLAQYFKAGGSDVSKQDVIDALNEMWGTTPGVGGATSPQPYQLGPQALMEAVRGEFITSSQMKAELDAAKTTLDGVNAAIAATGGHPADAPILAAVANAQAQLDAIAAKVTKDLA